MSRKYIIAIVVFLCVAVAACAAVFIFNDSKKDYTPALDVSPLNSFEETMRVAVDENHYPYSYLDVEGNLTGHDVEIAVMLANNLEMNIEFVQTDEVTAMKKLNDGKIDVVLGCTDDTVIPSNGQKSAATSFDTLTLFGVFRLTNPSTLYNQDVAVASAKAEYCIDSLGFNVNKHVCDTDYNAISEVLAGKCKYALLRATEGRAAVNKAKSEGKNIALIFESIEFGKVSNNFVFRNYEDFASTSSSYINKLRRNGTLERLDRKWGLVSAVKSESNFWESNPVVSVLLTVSFVTICCCAAYVIVSVKKMKSRRVSASEQK